MRAAIVQFTYSRCGYAALVAILGLGWATGAPAQVQRSGGGANAQLAQQYQQVVTERAQLQADNDKLKKQLDDIKKQLLALQQQLVVSKKSVESSASQLAAAQAASQTSAQSLEQTKTRMQELVNRFRDTAVTLRGVESDRSQLQQQLAQSKSDFDRCAERNYQLYQVDSEVLDHYEHEGTLDHLARAEPFTRIKRAQVENLVDEYKVRAEELRVQKAAPAPPGPAPGPSPVPFAAPAGSTGSSPTSTSVPGTAPGSARDDANSHQ
jgi:chromosome segregation ATPase